MSPSTHSKTGRPQGSGVFGAFVGFQVEPELAETAKATAARKGTTLSELLRHALRRELKEVA